MSKIVTIPINDHHRLLDKRFRIMHHIHNQIVTFCIGQMNELQKNREYKELLRQKSTVERNKRLKEIRQEYFLDEYKLQSRFKKMQKQYRDNIDAHAVQKECTRIYKGIEKCLFHNGKNLHRKRQEQFVSIECKTNKAGMRYDPASNTFMWCHQVFRLNQLNEYQQELLLNPISCCGIKERCLRMAGIIIFMS